MKELINISNYYYNQGLRDMKSNNLGGAIENLNRSIDFYGYNKEPYNLLAITYFLRGDFKSSLENMKTSILNWPENNDAITLLELMESQEFKEVLEDYNQAIEFYNKKDFLSAIESISRVKEKHPEIVEIYELLSSCYLNLEEDEKAAAMIEEIKTRDISSERLKILEKQTKELKDRVGHKKFYKGKKSIAAVLILTLALLFLNMYQAIGIRKTTADFNQDRNLLNENIKDLKKDNEKLIKKASLLEEEVKDLNLATKEKEKFSNQEIKLKVADEKKLFNQSYNDLINGDYEKAMYGFENIIIYGSELYLVKESTYFLALTHEYNHNIGEAITWYKKYIESFKGDNYYDESLYNCGLLLYKAGLKDEAGEILTLLVSEVPDSIYNNSKVDFILKQVGLR